MALKSLNVEQLHQLYTQEEKPLQLIDVREAHEWQVGHVPKSTHIPMGELSQRLTTQQTDKRHPLYLICRSGNRSGIVGKELCELGYEEVYNVEGGIMDWAMFGYPLSFE